MARHAEDHEDLLRDAKALVPRVLLQLPIGGEPCEVFAGFRGAAISLYFDSDPVYHFNSAGELRRAFVDGHILKAEAGRLQLWQAVRTTDEVTMLSRTLTSADEQEFRVVLENRITDLREGLARVEFELVGLFPTDSDVVALFQTWLANWGGFRIAAKSNTN